jgi:aminoglycoside phosphotransferase family enzyme/predicted kinase
MHAGKQDDVIAFLSDPSSYGPAIGVVETITTHASIVFLAGACAYKLKRAVRYSYLDYSSPELRRIACEAELALSRRTAPSLYLGVAAVNRTADGKLSFAGVGEAVDWLVVMRRFDQQALLDRVAADDRLTPSILIGLADHIADFHAKAERRHDHGGTRSVAALIEGNNRNLGIAEVGFDTTRIHSLRDASEATLIGLGDLLDARRLAGWVRHCHGDLHLNNVCLLDDRPTLFDCIEFSEEIACIDVLYDLAFLLMDLDRRDRRSMANLVFNRYLDLIGGDDGIEAMPLFLSLRAAIRAHVTAAHSTLCADAEEGPELGALAHRYLEQAAGYLVKHPPRLVAIGGLSGSGKSSLASELAPELGVAPGARVLRSDVIRKRLLGFAPETKLPTSAYSHGINEHVYETLRAKAASALRAGYGVIVDAVSARREERNRIAELAVAAGVPFTGLWLEAPPEVMEKRLLARRGDASDATPAVLQDQLAYELGRIDWARIDAGGDRSRAVAAARKVLAGG